MASAPKKISALSATAVADTDEYAVADSGTSEKRTWAALKTALESLFLKLDASNDPVTAAELHVQDSGATVDLRLESTNGSLSDWTLRANATTGHFSLIDNDNSLVPFKVFEAAPTDSLVIEATTGDIGFGTATPDYALDVERTSGAVIRAYATGADSSAYLLTQNDAQEWGAGVFGAASDKYQIRDITATPDTAPFSIEVGAPTDSLVIEATTGNVGMNTATPGTSLQINDSFSGGSLVQPADTGALWVGTDNNDTDNKPTGMFAGRQANSAGSVQVLESYGLVNNSSGTMALALSMIANLEVTGAGDATSVRALQAQAFTGSGSSGDVTNLVAGNFYTLLLGSGNVTNAIGLNVDIDDSGAGAITNGYGLYLDAIAGTNSWGVYQSAAGNDNYFAGDVGIGETSPDAALDVAGTIKILEQAAADGDTAGKGQLWVKNTTPCQLWFTDDAGTDTQIV